MYDSPFLLFFFALATAIEIDKVIAMKETKNREN